MRLSRTDLVPVLIYIDGVRIANSIPESLDSDDIESVEVLNGDAAAALYGEEAAAGVIQITLKEDRPQR